MTIPTTPATDEGVLLRNPICNKDHKSRRTWECKTFQAFKHSVRMHACNKPLRYPQLIQAMQ